MSKDHFSSLRALEYRDTAKPVVAASVAVSVKAIPPVVAPVLFTQEQVAAQVQNAVRDVEERWKAEATLEEMRRKGQMAASLRELERQKSAFFATLEGEVVGLALAIARKILQREAQVEPQALQAIVRRTLDRMGADSEVQVHVPPEEVAPWQSLPHFGDREYRCEIIPDATLQPGDCVVHTNLGHANVGFESQFEEIEQEILDLVRVAYPSMDADADDRLPHARETCS